MGADVEGNGLVGFRVEGHVTKLPPITTSRLVKMSCLVGNVAFCRAVLDFPVRNELCAVLAPMLEW